MCWYTGRYHLREPSDEKLSPQLKLKAMFPRIVRAQFPKPSWMTPSCCDLLSGLLQVQAEKRLTVTDVLAHPWFQEGEELTHICFGGVFPDLHLETVALLCAGTVQLRKGSCFDPACQNEFMGLMSPK